MEAQPVVSGDWLAGHLDDEDLVLVDVRPPQFYQQAHLPGAVNLPVFFLGGPPEPAALAQRLGALGIARDSSVVAYDDGASPSAAKLFWVLRYLGHGSASILDGGITKWRHDGRDWDYSPVQPQPVEYVVRATNPAVAVTLDGVKNRLDEPSTAIVDVRSPGEYLGVQTTAARNGHIPGAINIDWTNNLQPLQDGIAVLRADEELRGLYEEAGVTPDKDIVVYCQSGGRASQTYLALHKLGYPSVTIYVPGWQEWGNRDDTPIKP